MEWYLILAIILGSFLVLMALGLPIAFCFFFINLIGMFVFFGGQAGLDQLTLSVFHSVTTFSLLPLPLFILMGEVMFHSNIAPVMIDTLDKWLGNIPGRLSLLAVGAGTVFATLSGSTMSGVALLATTLVEPMERRGYKRPMSLGPILGSGGLSILIPPSGLAVILGALAQISIGHVLIAIIIPGVMLAAIYATYIVVRCWLQPSLAPAYHVAGAPLTDKLIATIRYILPIAFVVFLVVGVIFLGIATPSEAAASGAMGCFILAAGYKRLNWQVVKRAVSGTLHITVMMFMVMSGAKAFTQILACSGAVQGLVDLATGLPVTPILIIAAMQFVVLIMGCFMDPVPIMMMTVPVFFPIVNSLGFDPVWFAVMFLVNAEMAAITPPFGVELFVMRGLVPANVTMADIYLAGLPFVAWDILGIILIMIFPQIALWLPSVMF